MEAQLTTVEPNPGPVRRGWRSKNKTREKMERRRERRTEKKRRRRRQKRGGRRERNIKIVTWNVQGLSLRENNRRRLRTTLEYIERKGWEIVMMTEIRAETRGILWFGEGENETAVVHSERTAIILRGDPMRRWREERQRRKYTSRTTTVKIGSIKLVAVYQPVWSNGREGVERYREELEQELAESGEGEIVVIGGDHNAQVGREGEVDRVKGKYGLTTPTNEAGENLIEWCQEQDMAYANSFSPHQRRGTWFSAIHRRWYELDGFILKAKQRHKVMRGMRVLEETGMSDHRPVRLELKKEMKKWRQGKTRVPHIRHEKLKDQETKELYKRRIEEKWREKREGMEEGKTNWKLMGEVMVETAEEVCGRKTRQVANPWTIGHEEELAMLNLQIGAWVDERNRVEERTRTRAGRARWQERLEEVRGRVREARREMKNRLRQLEREWWDEIIEVCEEASRRGNIGEMYEALRKLGGRGRKAQEGNNITTEEFKDHFQKITQDRYEVEPQEIERAVEGVRDMREDQRAVEANEMLNETPGEEEIKKAMKETKDSAPGRDGVRVSYIREATQEMKEEMVRMVAFMFENRANKWEEELKIGQMVPLFKKGDKNNANNYRGVCLLAMASRILGRVMAGRLRWWSEHLGLTDENQNGFRPGRSTADATQIMMRIEEDAEDLRKRRRRAGEEEERESDPVARLLDLQKAYPRVNRPALWRILERYGLRGNFVKTLKDLHEATRYAVKGRGGESETWLPERGLREGCPTSPTLFNVFHQAVMRRAESARKEVAEREGKQVGVRWRWQPGSAFPSVNLWEKYSSETESRDIALSLFADDTTIVGRKDEIDGGVEEVKRVMETFEERNNNNKEETLVFGSEEGKEIRMLGCWMGAEEDIKQRKKRAGGLWCKLKQQLKHTRLSKRRQARVFEACVENALLFDCATRTWYVKDVKKLQQWADKCVRYIWSNKREPPLREMQRRGRNMQDIRNELNIKTVRWKIEKRVWERMGHVLRMDNTRMTKVAVMGWMEELEGTAKCPGRKRKTVLYWRKLVREAGVDWTEVGDLAADRGKWKEIIKERMEHLEEYDRSKGNLRTRQEATVIERNTIREQTEDELVCGVEDCRRRCKSKAGLKIKQIRMHKEARKEFRCERCGMIFESENTMINHSKACGGERAQTRDKRKCEKCGREISKSNIARHRRACTAGEREGGARGEVREEVVPPDPGPQPARVYRPAWAECPMCGQLKSVSNMARHKDRCRGGRP